MSRSIRWLAAIAVCAFLLTPLRAIAQISIVDPEVNSGGNPGTGNTSASETQAFTVTGADNCLVVQLAYAYPSGNTPNTAPSSLTWAVGSTTQTLTLVPGTLADAGGTGVSDVYTAIYYQFSPTVGAGTVTANFPASGGVGLQDYGISVLGLKNVNTNSSTVQGALSTTISGSGPFTVSATVNVAALNSFAAIAENEREAGGAASNFSLTAPTGTGITTTQQMNQFQNVFQLGSGVSSGFGTGSTTFTQSNAGASSNGRDEISVAVFAPLANVVWSGNSSGPDQNWSDGTNWVGGSAPTSANVAAFNAAYTNPGANIPIQIDQTALNVGGITFDTGALASMLIGKSNGNSLFLTGGGIIQTTATVGGGAGVVEAVNAPLVLGGGYTFTSGSTTTTPAALNFGGAISGGTGSGTVVLTLNGASTATNTISGAITNGGATALGLSVGGSTWVLSSTGNNFSGGITVASGTLQFSGASTGGLTINGGVFDLNGTSQIVTTFNGTGGTIVNDNNTSATLTVSGGGTASTVIANNNNSNSTTGTLALAISGSTLTLSGANTYSGGTTIAAGTLALGASSTVTSPITSGPAGTGGITLNLGGTLQMNDGPFTVANPIQVSGGASGVSTIQIIASATHTDTLSGAITLGNPLTVASQATNAAGLLVLGGNITGTATTGNTTTLTLTGSNTGSATTAGAGENYAASQISGVIADGTGGGNVAILKTGAGAWRLTTNNSYTGGTTISAGSIEIGAGVGGSAAGSGALGSGPVNVAAGAQLAFDFVGGTVTNNITLNGDTTINGLSAALVGDNLGGGGNNTLSGTLTLAGGVFSNVSTSFNDKSMTLQGLISGSGGLEVDLFRPAGGGAPPVVIVTNALNTYALGSLVNAGTLRVTGNTAIASGAIATGPLGLGPLTLSGGTLSDSGAAVTLANALNITASSGYTTTGGGSIAFDPTGLTTPTATTLSNSPTITVNNTTTIKEVVGGTGFTLAGNGTLVLGVANTYSGATIIGSGVLRLANTNAAQNSTVTVNNNGGLTFSAGLGAATLGGLAGSASGKVLLQDSTPAAINLSVGNNNAGTTYSGVLAGLGSLTKIGSGILTLGNANTYSGSTTITSGTLRYGISDPTLTQTSKQALTSPATAGNQIFGGSTNPTATGGTLGTEFVVPTGGITITGLGLFAASNNTGSSTANPIVTTSHEVAIFSVTSPTSQALVAGLSLNDTAAQWNAGAASADGYRFITLTTPVFLAAGTYDIASDGWGTDENYNNGVAGGVGLNTINTQLTAGANNLNGGASTQGSNAFPTNTDGVLKYSAANFDFYGGRVIPGAVTINGSTATLDMAGNTGTVLAVTLDGGGTITSSSGTGTLTSNTAFNLNFGTVSSGVVLAGTAGLTKSTGTGGNLVTLGGTHTYTGATTVNDGILRVTGSLSSASAVTVGSASVGLSPILAGTGTINGPVTLLGTGTGGSPGILAPSAGGSAGSVLTINAPLTLNTGSILNFTLTPTAGGPGNDQVLMTGNNLLTVGASGTVNITATGSLTQGSYVLISNPFGSASGTGAGWVANVTGDTSHSYSLAVVGSNFDLTVGVAPDVWTGATNGVWDINTTPNWSTSSGKYTDGDNVIFDDTGLNTTNITITGTVNPTSIAFNNVAKAYTINNSGTIAGSAQLALTKGGTLTLNNTNTFTGATTVSGGSTLNIGGTYSSTFITVSGSGSNFNVPLGASIAAATNLTLNTSAAASFSNGSQTLATLGGDGSGTLTLSGTSLTLTGSGTVGTKIIDNGSGAALTVSGGAVSLTNGANNYDGGTTVTGGGTLSVPIDGTVSGTSTPLGTIPGSPATNLTINGGTFRASGTYALATNRSVAVGPSSGSGSGTIDVTGANTLTIGGAIGNNGGGSGQLIKTDTGTLTLTGTNNLSGGIAINGGTVQAISSANLGSGPITFGGSGSGGTLAFFNPSITTYIPGFGTGTGFQLNGTGQASISSSTLTITTAAGNEATSAIYTTKVPVGAFTAQFTYKDTAGGAGNNADGATFFLQSNSTTAVGGAGGGLGYSGITPSFAFALNIFTGAAGGVGTEVTNNGTVGTNVSTSPVNLASGDPILVTLSYNGSLLSYTLTDQSNNNTFTNSTAINIPGFMAGGSNQAFAGFSGGTGGQDATQTFSNFTYTSNGVSTPLAISSGASVASGSTGTISISGYPSATIPSLALGGGSTLNVTGASLTSSGTSFAGSATINTGLGVTLTTGPITGSIGSGNSLTKTGGGTLSVNNASDGATTFSGSTVNITGGSLSTLAGTTTSGLGTSNWNLSGANLTITGTAVSGTGLAGSFWPLSPGDNGNAAPYSNGTGKAPNTMSNNWPTGNNVGVSSSADDATIGAFGTPPTGFSNVTLPTTANVTNPPGGPTYTYSGGINFPNTGNAFAAIGIDISGGNGTAGTGGNSPPYSGATSGYNSLTAQWKGTVTLATAGTLNLAVNSDDFAAIAVDGTIVAARGNGGTGFSANNGGTATSPGGGSIASVSLTAGIHSIEVLYDEGGGGWGIITGYNFNGGNTGSSSFPFAIGQNDSTDGISFAGPLAGPTLSNLISVSGASSLTLNAGTGTSLGALTMNGGREPDRQRHFHFGHIRQHRGQR